MIARVIRARVRKETREMERRPCGRRSEMLIKERGQDVKFLRLLFGYEISCCDLYKDDRDKHKEQGSEMRFPRGFPLTFKRCFVHMYTWST